MLDNANCKSEDREIILCGMWSLWNNRNDHRHGMSSIEPGLAVDWALEACFHLSIGSQAPDGGKESTQQEVWRPPADGTLKVNIDGAFTQDTCMGAVGAVVRCTAGRFRVVSARRLRSVGSALLAGKRKRSGPHCCGNGCPGAGLALAKQGYTPVGGCNNLARC